MRNLAIIGARLSSSRLPQKHLLNLGGKPLILRVLECLEQVEEIDETIVATTSENVNQPLIDLLHQNQKLVFVFEGPTSDLVGRVAAIVAKKKPANIIYACGDTPLIRPALVRNMLSAAEKEPLKKPTLEPAPNEQKWMHEGIDVFPIAIFEQMVKASIHDHHREHFGSVLHEIPHLKSMVHEASQYATNENIRLSVDTQTDYQVMQQLFEKWQIHHPDLPIDFDWAITSLNKNSNAHVRQRTIHDPNSRTIHILTSCGPKIGMGHLSRTSVLARALIEHFSYGIKIWILGETINFKPLQFLNHEFVSKIPVQTGPWIVDTPFPVLANEKKVLIDGESNNPSDLVVKPSFLAKTNSNQLGGWPYYLISTEIKAWPTKKDHLLVLSGGSDAWGLGQSLAPLLPSDTMPITWVQGPLAPRPQANSRVSIIQDPDMSEVYRDKSWAITAYGISFFECLQAGLKTIVIADPRLPGEMEALRKEEVAFVVENPNQAITILKEAPQNAEKYRQQALHKMDGHGPQRVAQAIHEWLQK